MARFMAKLFFAMGYVSNADIIQYSATDLVGQYLGQTRHRTREKLTNALDRFLFISDIHLLLEGAYEAQALEELAEFLSRPETHQNMVVVLSGDDKSIDKLKRSSYISTVFREIISFQNIPADDCITLLSEELRSFGFSDEAQFMKSLTPPDYEQVKGLWHKMQSAAGWNNAHDVKYLAKQIAVRLLELDELNSDQAKGQLLSIVMNCMKRVITDRSVSKGRAEFREPDIRDQTYSHMDSTSALLHQESTISSQCHPLFASHCQSTAELSTDAQIQPTMNKTIRESRESAASPSQRISQVRANTNMFGCAHDDEKEHNAEEEIVAKREEGVADSSWDRVQTAIEEEKKDQVILQDFDEKLQQAGDALFQGTTDELEDLQKSYDRAKAIFSAHSLRLQLRHRILMALRKMGKCPLGYAWVRDGEGYRCTGGSHFVTNEEANNMVADKD